MFKIQYLVSLFTFYRRGEISLDSYFIRFHRPETKLGVIAAGGSDTSVPVPQIASVSKRFGIQLLQLSGALLLTAAGVVIFRFFPRFFWIALILLLFAVNALLQAFVIKLTVRFLSGQETAVSFMLFEKAKADEAERAIGEVLVRRMEADGSSSRYGDVS